MKKTYLFLMCSLLFQISHAQNMASKIDEAIQAYVKFNKFNGSVLVAQKGKILFEKGYGYRDVNAQLVNNSSTIFLIGSLTKEFTAAIILKLAEQKKLSITDKLDKYYPDFPKGELITVQNLLTHTSGIFNYGDTRDFFHQSALHTNEHNVMDTLRRKQLLFTPGEKYSYSNSNYMLLAYIIQKVTNQSYESIVRNWIFKPLGMDQSGFDFTGLKSPDKAKGYWDFSAAKITEARPVDSTQFIGSGEIYSTTGDLYKWHRALQSYKFLTRASLQQAYQPFKEKYGYGWELDTLYHKQIIGHAGKMWGFEAKMIRVPEDDVFVILLANNSDGPYIESISKKITAIIYHQPYSLPEQPLMLTEEQMKAYTGTYSADPQHSFEVRIGNGHLFGVDQPGEKMTLELFPIKDNNFKFMEREGEEGTFKFVMDEKGKANEMTTITPRGTNISLKRIK